MEILRFELLKIFKNNKGIVLIPIAVIIIIFLNIISSNPINQGLEIKKDEYKELTENYNLIGKVTTTSVDSLNKLTYISNKAKSDFDTLLLDFQLGKIDSSEYLKEASSLSEKANLSTTIKIIQTQFDYALKDTDNRYVLYSNGWEMVFTHSGNIYFILLAILIITLSFYGDTDGGFKYYILTCETGKIKLPLIKAAVSGALIFLLYILYLLMYFLYIREKFGLPDGNFPIQSLQMYSEYTGAFSIIETYVIVSFVRLISVLSCAAFVFCCYTLLNTSIGAISISSSLLFLPFLIKDDLSSVLPQKMCNYELYDLNFLSAVFINFMVILVLVFASVMFWKRKSSLR